MKWPFPSTFKRAASLAAALLMSVGCASFTQFSEMDGDSGCGRQEDPFWIYSSGPGAEMFQVMYVNHSPPGTFVEHRALSKPVLQNCPEDVAAPTAEVTAQ